MKAIALTAVVALSMAGLVACSDPDDDVVQPPAPDAAPEAVTETRADTAMTSAAVAMGMTRQELEDADVLSTDNTDLGDVETLVLDAAGTLTGVVVELEGPGDPRVVVPVDQLTSITSADGSKDLTTTLTAAQLQALPAWTANAG